MPRPPFRVTTASAMLSALVALVASGCTPAEAPPAYQPTPPTVQAQPLIAPITPPPATPATQTPMQTVAAGRAKVALLAPLSGPNKPVGQAMLDAANMALFDVSSDLALLPRDTGSTPDDARAAAGRAISDGAELILGPVFSASVPPVREAAQGAPINGAPVNGAPVSDMSLDGAPVQGGSSPAGPGRAGPGPGGPVSVIAFTTDAAMAGGNVLIMGFLPAQQVERVVGFAKSRGMNKLAALVPDNAYGAAITAAIGQIQGRLGLTPPRIITVGHDPKQQIAGLADDPPQMLLIALGGEQLTALAPALADYAAAHPVQLLGTGLWDDAALSQTPGLTGGWYAAPPPQNFVGFTNRFQRLYNYRPPRIATLAYDSVALATSIARNAAGNPNPFAQQALLQPNGFVGIDGGFRFLPSGMSERNLAVLAVGADGPVVIDPPPRGFEKLGE